MPMYFDVSKVKKPLTGGHIELAAQFIEALRERNYFDRGHDAPVDELALDDLTSPIIATWAYIRRAIVRIDPHIHFRHQKGLADDHSHAEGLVIPVAHVTSTDKDGVTTRGHGHITPPLFIIAERVQKDADENPIDEREFRRAERDLHDLVGMRVAASRSKVSADAVFGVGD